MMPRIRLEVLIFVLLIHIKAISTFQCYKCPTKYFDYPVTADALPTTDGCLNVTGTYGCIATVNWYQNGTSEVSYIDNHLYALEVVHVRSERRQPELNQNYISHFISYFCRSTDELCNTGEQLKRAVISTMFPSEQQMAQFDDLLLAPSTPFKSNSCLAFSNQTSCSDPDLVHGTQCSITLENQNRFCATCQPSEFDYNFLFQSTWYILNNRTLRDSTISLSCQVANQCNSFNNIERIRQATASKFDYDRFFGSMAVITKPTMVILALLVLLIF